MSHYSNADFVRRIEGRQVTPYHQPDPFERLSLRELKSKLIKATDRAYHFSSKGIQKQIRAASGSCDLRRWLK